MVMATPSHLITVKKHRRNIDLLTKIRPTWKQRRFQYSLYRLQELDW